MHLKIFHFYPDKMNLYGDRGNIIVLKKRAEARGIDVEVVDVKSVKEVSLSEADILFIGGGSDREQNLVTDELFYARNELKGLIEDGVASLMICGGYQFLGEYYQTPAGERLSFLNILDLHTIGKNPRLIGNVLIESNEFGKVVGFENHGGYTYHEYETFGKVIKGHGNNGEDGKEGLIYKNLIGTYLHGPLLPKNPKIADWLLGKALDRKYGKGELDKLDDKLEKLANETVWKMYF